jgi:hypothetical protein
MYDIYNYREDKVSTQSGTPLKYFPNYVFVSNKPKWDSVEYWLGEWKNYDESKYNNPSNGNTTWEKFVNHNKSYWKKGTLEKLTKYMVELEKELVSLGYTQEELMEVA